MGLRTSIISGACVAAALFVHGVIAPDDVPASKPQGVIPVIGHVPTLQEICAIDNLGAVGLGPDLPDSRYVVVSDHLVRLDIASGQIMSILRPLSCPTR